MKLAVRACLLGIPCRYDGESRPCPEVMALLSRHTLIPVCPEQMGGLPTPRPPAERVGDRVINRHGTDVTAQYKRGAEAVLAICRLTGCKQAILKEKSPACGCGRIYDGSFTRVLTEGDGVCAELLKAAGIRVLGESECGTIGEA